MLAQKIKRARVICGKTQEDVCETLGWSTSKYSRLETGERQPSIAELRLLADCFGVPFESLIGNTPLVIQFAPAQEGDEQSAPQDPNAMRDLSLFMERQTQLFSAFVAQQSALLERLGSRAKD